MSIQFRYTNKYIGLAFKNSLQILLLLAVTSISISKSVYAYTDINSIRSLNFKKSFPSNKEVNSYLYEVAKKFPQNASVFDLGPSDSGEMIKGLAIGRGPVNNLVVATHHGNEYGSTAVALGFAAYLAQYPLQGQRIFVIPVLNIGGYNSGARLEWAMGRSWDPNRNYPSPCGTQGPFTLKSTHALAQFVDKANIITSATLHTYFPGVLYPWGISTHDTKTPYDSTFIKIGEVATQESKYKVGNATELLYPADGTFEDYAFWKHGVWSMLFEMGHSHYPSDQAIETMIALNVPGLRRMFEMAPKARATDHEFRGQCDTYLMRLNLRED